MHSKWITSVACAIAAVTTTAWLLGFAPIPGTLEPPSGAVSDTTPSLAELEDKINALSAMTAGGRPGPGIDGWESYQIGPVDNANDVPAATVAALPGRVFVHRISAFKGVLAIFDEPGSITLGSDVAPDAANPTPLGFVGSTTFGNGSTGGASRDSIELVLDVVFENGVYVTYSAGDDSYFQILYRTLD